jgi:vancomycin resistance protein VanJ
VIAFFGYLDFNVPLALGASGDVRLRVISYNIAQRDLTTPWLGAFLARESPDVLALVECRPPDPFEPPDERYHFDKSYGLCLLSRFPITKVDARNQRDAFDRGGTAAITLFTLSPAEAPSFQVLVVHLASPRGAIEPLLHDRFDGFAAADEHMALRDWEAGLAREWLARADRPVMVLGDFNLTDESAIFRRHFGDLTSAFSRCGLGFGNTKHTRKFGSRIDHILMTDAYDCDDATVLDIDGSDHRPLASTLTLRAQ